MLWLLMLQKEVKQLKHVSKDKELEKQKVSLNKRKKNG